jgi:hypothetical protein
VNGIDGIISREGGMIMDVEQIEKIRVQARHSGWLIAGLLVVIVSGAAAHTVGIQSVDTVAGYFASGLLVITLVGATVLRQRSMWRIARYEDCVDLIDDLLACNSSFRIRELSSDLRKDAERDPVIDALAERMRPAMRRHLNVVVDAETQAARRASVEQLASDAKTAALSRLDARREQSPVIRAERMIAEALDTIKRHRALAESQFNEKHEKSFFKWTSAWNRPDFTEVDARIAELEQAGQRLLASGDIEKTNRSFAKLKKRIAQRVTSMRTGALRAIPPSAGTHFDAQKTVRAALILGGLSVPVSAWRDALQAGDIYNSLREVNGNYAGMSDFDIWLDTLIMPGEQLAGLAAVTKGAWFEKLVETDFSGERFEHFNHPDTDILIDGVAYQIKATDSVSYIATVDGDIPVISTSEIASITGSIDGGYTDAALTDGIDLAFGGTIFDISDTVFDAVLSGVGGVGLFSVIKGINTSWRSYQASGDAIGSLVDGMTAIAVNTARSVVNLAELGWRGTAAVVKSPPARFAGRVAGGMVGKLDRWLESEPNSAAPGSK